MKIIITGLLLLNNPDIEFISATGALLMCAGYIPWGARILQGRMKCSSKACPIYDTKKDKRDYNLILISINSVPQILI